jgi:hypothetical protein
MAIPKEKTRHPENETEWNFPYCHKVFQFQDGTCMLVNEENGKNNFLFQHGVSGTYTEINNSGDQITFTVGNKVEYGKSGTTVTVKHNGDVYIAGMQRTMVQGGAHIEVAGDAGIVVGGHTVLAGIGRVNIAAESFHLTSAKDFTMNVGGKLDIVSKGDTTMHAQNILMNGATSGFSGAPAGNMTTADYGGSSKTGGGPA